MTNEAFSRVKIDARLRAQSWEAENPNAVRFEYMLVDDTRVDYVLCNLHGPASVVIEVKRLLSTQPKPKAKRKPMLPRRWSRSND